MKRTITAHTRRQCVFQADTENTMSSRNNTTRSHRTRSRRQGSVYSYDQNGKVRWRYQIWVPRDPDYPDLGLKKTGKAGFLTSADADDALQVALTKRKNNERFSDKIPKLGAYAKLWLQSRPRLEASTLKGYRKQIRNHVIPALGEVRLDQITATRLARHYRDLESSGRKDHGHEGEPLSPNTVRHVSVLLGSMLTCRCRRRAHLRQPCQEKGRASSHHVTGSSRETRYQYVGRRRAPHRVGLDS